MDQILKNHNSSVNQRIKGELVNREIYCNFTFEMNQLLSMGDDNPDCPCYDEIENYYSYPEFYGNYYNFDGGDEEDKNSILEEIQNRIDSFDAILDYYTDKRQAEKAAKIEVILDQLYDDQTEIENLETKPAEIYEWYAVTNWFAEKLKAYGECILDYGCNVYWGRQACGQAVLLDYVIGKIACDLEILEGQESSWAE